MLPVMKPQYRTATAAGIATQAMVVISWLATQIHVTIPTDVSAALAFFIALGVAWLVHPSQPPVADDTEPEVSPQDGPKASAPIPGKPTGLVPIYAQTTKPEGQPS